MGDHMLVWSSKISTIFIVNYQIAIVFETITCLIKKNHCGGLVEPHCGFCSDFVYAKHQ